MCLGVCVFVRERERERKREREKKKAQVGLKWLGGHFFVTLGERNLFESHLNSKHLLPHKTAVSQINLLLQPSPAGEAAAQITQGTRVCVCVVCVGG